MNVGCHHALLPYGDCLLPSNHKHVQFCFQGVGTAHYSFYEQSSALTLFLESCFSPLLPGPRFPFLLRGMLSSCSPWPSTGQHCELTAASGLLSVKASARGVRGMDSGCHSRQGEGVRGLRSETAQRLPQKHIQTPIREAKVS